MQAFSADNCQLLQIKDALQFTSQDTSNLKLNQISIKGNFLQNLTEFIKDGPSEGDLSISSHK